MATTGAFSSTLKVPAGGWYGLRLRAGKDGETVAEANVEHFGVGEVFVGAGQSNSTNAGEHRTRQHSGMVSTFDGTSWRLADDPQPGVHDRSTGGSFWPAFGDALHGRLGVPIGVAVTGHGGTSVDRWRTDGELYGWMLRRIRRLGPLGFRAVLWHQGESDSLSTPQDEYYAALRRIILQSREDAGWELPWFVAQATYLDPQRPSFPGIRGAQARLWKDGIALRGPDTDELRGDHRDHDGQGIHFSPEGLKAHGELWAGILGDYVEACHGR